LLDELEPVLFSFSQVIVHQVQHIGARRIFPVSGLHPRVELLRCREKMELERTKARPIGGLSLEDPSVDFVINRPVIDVHHDCRLANLYVGNEPCGRELAQEPYPHCRAPLEPRLNGKRSSPSVESLLSVVEAKPIPARLPECRFPFPKSRKECCGNALS